LCGYQPGQHDLKGYQPKDGKKVYLSSRSAYALPVLLKICLVRRRWGSCFPEYYEISSLYNSHNRYSVGGVKIARKSYIALVKAPFKAIFRSRMLAARAFVVYWPSNQSMKTLKSLLTGLALCLAQSSAIAQPRYREDLRKTPYSSPTALLKQSFESWNTYADLVPLSVIKHYGGKPAILNTYRRQGSILSAISRRTPHAEGTDPDDPG